MNSSTKHPPQKEQRMTAQTTDTGLLAGTWTLDPAHTTIGFTARHLMSKVRGTFNEFDGRITTTTNPLESTIEVTIKASSISTNNEVTRSVDLQAEFLGSDVSPFGMTVLGAEATTTIDRHDYNVNWNMPLDGGRLLVGPKIDITLSVE